MDDKEKKDFSEGIDILKNQSKFLKEGRIRKYLWIKNWI